MKRISSKKRVTVIIPALNEEKSIGDTIESIPVKKLNQMGCEVEIIVVDGNSSDKTREIAQKKGAKVVIEPRKGYGRAYKTGFKNASGDIIVTTDADLTYPTEKLDFFVKYFIYNDIDFLSTNRFWRYDRLAWSPINIIGNKLLTILVNFLFFMKMKDSQSGMWIFKREILKKVTLQEDGMAFSTEIKIVVHLNRFRFVEIPIHYRKRPTGSKSKLSWFRDGLNILNFIIRKRLVSLF